MSQGFQRFLKEFLDECHRDFVDALNDFIDFLMEFMY